MCTGFFNRLFGKDKRSDKKLTGVEEASEKPPIGESATLPAVERKTLETPVQTRDKLDLPQLIAGCGQSPGKQRDHNEDAIFMFTTNMASGSSQVQFGLYMVADGMGGHQNGAIASDVAIRVMASLIIRKLYLPLFNLPEEHPTESLQEIMQEGIYEAHRSILKHAPGGGTTLTAALIIGDQLSIMHVGDSRAYALNRDGQLQVLTRDHSLVKRLEELGHITPEEAQIHPQRNVLYRALGQGEPFEPDFLTFPLEPISDIFLCSDGLWGVVPNDEIHHIICSRTSPQQACQKLIDAANAAGGPDNISAILAHMPE